MTIKPTSLITTLAFSAGVISSMCTTPACGEPAEKLPHVYTSDYAPDTPASGHYVLTPKVGPVPRINGAAVFGVRPGSKFLFTVAATGEAPLTYSATALPEGLSLDAATGQITGVIQSRELKTYPVSLQVRNTHGQAERELRIVVGDRIALTPPMGWNSWNSWAFAVDEGKVRATAEAMARLLKGHGWTYVNIDDAWQGGRGGPFNAIQPNEKFPDMKKLADDIHALGLKLGIYSTPWVTSYAGYNGGSADSADGAWRKPGPEKADRRKDYRLGEFPFDSNDAQQWAEWGIDYLKYDWHASDLINAARMEKALRAQSRDIFYSLSNTAPFAQSEGFAEVANAWRTTGDIRDLWNAGMRTPKGFKGLYDIWLMQERWAPVAGPGHWPDPDMLVVGNVGWGPKLHASKLTADEQYTHISLWSLWAAPLLIGCPIEDMDEFTLNLLTNDEVLAVNQDPLGRMATTVLSDGDRQVVAKPMEDGSVAVGLFNRGETTLDVTVPWIMLVFDAPGQSTLWRHNQTSLESMERFRCQVRDLWRQKDIGDFTGQFTATVPAHGVVFIRVKPVQE
ncbi:MAG: putative Ig domain-containing protein [Kiritimatiellales bacterium]|nr:putative Ig domain-containing protein [Kiritimatiellales bacterium]